MDDAPFLFGQIQAPHDQCLTRTAGSADSVRQSDMPWWHQCCCHDSRRWFQYSLGWIVTICTLSPVVKQCCSKNNGPPLPLSIVIVGCLPSPSMICILLIFFYNCTHTDVFCSLLRVLKNVHRWPCSPPEPDCCKTQKWGGQLPQGRGEYMEVVFVGLLHD